jgi:agmatine/peptidylarginine deiminase
MFHKTARLVAALMSLCVLQLACYNKYDITAEQLTALTSSNIAEVVLVELPQGPVAVRASTPIQLITESQGRRNISPFNFSLTNTQLIAPDYDLLLPRAQISGARIQEYNKGRTMMLVVGSVLAAGASFAVISVLAGSDSGPGE